MVLGWLYFQKLAVLNEIKKEIDQVEVALNAPELIDKVNLVTEIETREKSVKDQMAVLESISGDQTVWLSFLDDLSARLPQGVWISALGKATSADKTKTGKLVDIDGYSINRDRILEFYHNLGQSPLFNVSILGAITESIQNGTTFYQFRITCESKNTLYPDL